MQKFLSLVGLVGLVASQAQAALTVDPISQTDFMTVAGAVVVALGAFYAVRKALALIK